MPQPVLDARDVFVDACVDGGVFGAGLNFLVEVGAQFGTIGKRLLFLLSFSFPHGPQPPTGSLFF